MDAWEDNDEDDAVEPVLVDLDKHGKTMKKLFVWMPRPLGDDDDKGPPTVGNFKIRWSTIHAKFGMFNDINMKATNSYHESSSNDDEFTDDENN